MLRKKKHTLIASDRVEGTAVRRPKGDKIGSIERLMIDKVSGKVAYAVLSFGGFLGIGHKHLPIPWSLLNYNVELDAYELDIADDVLRKAPSSEQSSEFDFGDRAGGGEALRLLQRAAVLGLLSQAGSKRYYASQRCARANMRRSVASASLALVSGSVSCRAATVRSSCAVSSRDLR